MKILITGICGFVGKNLASYLKQHLERVEIFGIDNLCRAGSEQNRLALKELGIKFFHGDLRNPSDLEAIPACDAVIDAAANPRVLAGVDGLTSSYQLMDHNLTGTLHLLEKCKTWKSKLILLSTSRVYSIQALSSIPLKLQKAAFFPSKNSASMGYSVEGIQETFSTTPPLSLYGSSKLASEILAMEYAATFSFPLFINRCGVLAGAGQFGRADQGIFSFWIHSFQSKRPLKYIGFEGKGYQVRDCLHPDDLSALVVKQLKTIDRNHPTLLHVSGGRQNSCSLAQLHAWCENRFSPRKVEAVRDHRNFDIPWLILDSALAKKHWKWSPQRSLESIFTEISHHADQNPNWLDLTSD
jgi:CDP-paratose 2-epimerase